jgi:hypothetical protein
MNATALIANQIAAAPANNERTVFVLRTGLMAGDGQRQSIRRGGPIRRHAAMSEIGQPCHALLVVRV